MFMIVAAHTITDMDFDTLSSFHKKVHFLRDPNTNHVELSSRNNTNPSIIGPDNLIATTHVEIDNHKRNNPRDKYSEGVYICKEQIRQIISYLDANNTYQGVKLYFASYNKKMDCVKYKVKEQFTLILAPVPDKDSKPSLKDYIEFLKNKFANQYYNHGSLCPNRCPTD